MTPINRRRFAALLGSTLVAGCASPAVVTRNDPKDPFEGGIGGTGIVGLMTDFGSLIVNGLRVEVTGGTYFGSPFGRVSEGAAQPGVPLTIVAQRSRDRLVAQDVRLAHPLIGTVAQGRGGGLTVNGARVRVEPGARGALRPGARVEIGGLWAPGGTVVATRIDPARAPSDLIAGTAGRDASGGLTVQGVPVRTTSSQPLPSVGSYITVLGAMSGTTFAADRLLPRRFVTGASRLKQLSVEGFLEPSASAPGFRIAGLGHSFARNLRLAELQGRRAVYFGGYDGLFGATAGYVVPENASLRRALLRAGYEDGFGGSVVRTGG